MPQPIRKGQVMFLSLAQIADLDPCVDQLALVRDLADADGYIPLTEATITRAVDLEVDLEWFAARLGVDCKPLGAEYCVYVAAYGAAYLDADDADRATRLAAFKAACARAYRVHVTAVGRACLRALTARE